MACEVFINHGSLAMRVRHASAACWGTTALPSKAMSIRPACPSEPRQASGEGTIHMLGRCVSPPVNTCPFQSYSP